VFSALAHVLCLVHWITYCVQSNGSHIVFSSDHSLSSGLWPSCCPHVERYVTSKQNLCPVPRVAFLSYPQGWHFDALLVLNNKDYSNGRLPFPSLAFPSLPPPDPGAAVPPPLRTPAFWCFYWCVSIKNASSVGSINSKRRAQTVYGDRDVCRHNAGPVCLSVCIRRSQAKSVSALPNHRLHFGTVNHCDIKLWLLSVCLRLECPPSTLQPTETSSIKSNLQFVLLTIALLSGGRIKNIHLPGGSI
jgi:hypothetical protein